MADAVAGPKVDLEVAVRRKGETDFTVVETKRLPDEMAIRLAKMAKGEDA